MKYEAGGVSGELGKALVVDVPIAARAEPAGTASSPDSSGSSGAKEDAKPVGPVTKEQGEDILVDPPVRNLPQWDTRWGGTRMAGQKTGMMLDWKSNGCNASTAAMTLRWFAEDCPSGKIPFPFKPGGSIKRTWYSPAMGECFWPNADPPGKVALDSNGRIDTAWIFSVAAHYLQTGGDIPRAGNGDIDHIKSKAYTVEHEPPEGWMALLRKMLKTGPVIVGLGAPSGHYVIAHAIIGGAVAIVDPGNVLCNAHKGKGGEIQNWASMPGYLDGTTDPIKVRMPPDAQWPGGDAPGNEGDGRAYNLVSGQFLQKILDNLHRLVSLTYPGGAKFGGAPASQPDQKQQSTPAGTQPQSTPAGAPDEDDEEEAVGASSQQEPEPTGKKETCQVCGQPRKHCEMKSRPKTRGEAIKKVELDVRLLHQFDPSWSKVQYFDRGTIGQKGCLLTSLTMMIGFLRRSTLEGERPNPHQMLDYVSKHSHKGGWTQGCAFYPNPESQPEPTLVLKNFPSKSRMIDFDHQHATLDKIDECLDRGLPVCVDVLKPDNYTKALHYVVIYGRKADGNYLIRDPGYSKPVELGPHYRALADIYWFEPA